MAETLEGRNGRVSDTMGGIERLASVVAGGVISLAGMQTMRRFLAGAGLTAAGAYLLYRGITGRCPVRDAVQEQVRSYGRGAQQGRAAGRDAVEQASMESFPASDPPGWTH